MLDFGDKDNNQTQGTIDDDILKALTAKDAQQSRLIEAVKAQVGG